MRILVINNYYPPYVWGDNYSYCRKTVDFLIRKKHEVFILTGNYGLSSLPIARYKSGVVNRLLKYVDYEHAGSLDRYLIDRHNFKTTSAFIKQVKPDIVYLWNMEEISIGPVIAVMSKHIPRLFQLNNIWPDKYIKQGFISETKRFFKKLLPNAVGGQLNLNPAVVSSQWLINYFQKNYDLEIFHHIKIGVEIPAKVPVVGSKKNVNYTYYGRLAIDQKIEILLDAFQTVQLKHNTENFQLNFYGEVDTSYLIELQKRIKDVSLKQRVKFHGKPANFEEPFKAADVLVQPIVRDDLDLQMILSAMARKKVVIIPDHPASQELVVSNENGIIFKQENAEDLIQAVLSLQSDQTLLPKMAEAAFKTIEKQHEINVMNQQIEDVLLSEINRQKGRK